MGTENAKKPPHIGAADEALSDGPAPTGKAPGGAGRRGFPPDPAGGPRRISGLSPASVTIVVLAVVGVVVAAVVHLAMVFLHAAPTNSFSQQHVTGITNYVTPDFAQGWKLFAPNPQDENSHVQARAQVLMPDGSLTTTSWVDLGAMDEARIVHNAFPSQTQQSELFTAWSNFANSQDGQGRPLGALGNLTQQYLLRIVAQRFGPHLNGGTVVRIQLRSAVTPVQTPPWVHKKIDASTSYQLLPWWPVKTEDFK
ncbi:DUF5819 family protein [Streptomyces sp. NPDC101227]|uniref:DUF5819 family protein n=1 Tax=Streptomyces sp. NPDC101227 TaxID=3366136 RepID=UPI003821775B